MKYLFSLSMLVAVIGLTSCEKCATCSCENTIVYEFDEGIEESTQTDIENAYSNEFNEDYPEIDNQEVCAKRRDHEAAVTEFESKSYSFDETNKSNGKEWSIDADRVCTCVE